MRKDVREMIRFAESICKNQNVIKAFEYKIKGKLREIRHMFNSTIDYYTLLFFPKWCDEIYISENYVLMYKHYRQSTLGIVIGENDNSKVFVNFISGINKPKYVGEGIAVNDKKTLVFPTWDNQVYIVLGYNFEYDTVDKIIPNKWYRVQGDLIMSVRAYEDYISENSTVLQDQVDRYFELLILRRIQRILEDYGLTSELSNPLTIDATVFALSGSRRFELDIWGLRRTWSYEERHKVKKKIGDIIKSDLYISDIMKVNEIMIDSPYQTYIKIRYKYDEITYVNILIFEGRGEYGFAFYPIQIWCEISPRLGVIWSQQILTECKEEIESLIDEYTYNMGRHMITYYGYPHTVTITYEMPTIEKEPIVFSFRRETLFTTKRTIKIKHVEHGNKTIVLPYDKCALSFENTNTLETYNGWEGSNTIAKRNSYVFREWLKE